MGRWGRGVWAVGQGCHLSKVYVQRWTWGAWVSQIAHGGKCEGTLIEKKTGLILKPWPAFLPVPVHWLTFMLHWQRWHQAIYQTHPEGKASRGWRLKANKPKRDPRADPGWRQLFLTQRVRAWILSDLDISKNFANKLSIFIYLVNLFLPFRAVPKAHGGSQARGRMGAVAASLYHSHSSGGAKPCLRPTPQLMAMPDP